MTCFQLQASLNFSNNYQQTCQYLQASEKVIFSGNSETYEPVLARAYVAMHGTLRVTNALFAVVKANQDGHLLLHCKII